MRTGYPESFVCAFCQDKYCFQTDDGRRVTFINFPLIEKIDQSIADCPKFRACIDFIQGRTDELPLVVDIM